ncbi:putative 3-hydroxybutyryl-CoA dehydrogenase [Smittium mucronatum]|uniref:Putative 3-hydroxybutyryl-CoA dehydrogenase n=1 Tax=Smittium mucronatum TaxID=133383 RepID=A0A1R0GSQ4_9FUNG|nr:putative 3-hydroxybutyryl-CoA dehydrogenase [Smittium mucronatum]
MQSRLSLVSKAVRDIQRLAVIGSGQMGTGIGLVAARYAKVKVQLVDSNPVQLNKGLSFIRTLLEKDEKKGRISKIEIEEVISRISLVDGISQLDAPDFVIEAASENLAIKGAIFKELSEKVGPECILATNTSSISITKIAGYTNCPERVVGMHFMNPVPVMKLVELIPALQTDSSVVEKTKEFAERLGKTVTTSTDSPGFIANRLLMPYINEAVMALESGIGSREDIDTTMKLGTRVPMGPLELADFIGLDTCLAIMQVLHTEFGDSKYRPSVLLTKYVDAGWLGKKTGRGFYTYSN